MSYKHLTLNERNKIEVLNKEGYSSRRIMKILYMNYYLYRKAKTICFGFFLLFQSYKKCIYMPKL
mgnify:CR=1 FL=1